MSQTERIFVYGTLRPPRPGTAAADSRFYPHIAPYIRSATPARLPDAELYNLGAYPALKPGQGVVYGDLLEVEPVVVEITDRIEGHPHFYRRAEVKVHLENDSTAAAWVYWALRGITLGRPRIGCGDWFQRRTENCQDLATPANEPLPEEAPVEATLQALVRRFAESDCSWLSSIRSDGRAHSAPVWHVWHQSRIYVVTTSKAVKMANIQENPSVVMTHPDPMNPIIIEGWAALSLIAQQQLQPLFAAKYDWDINTSPEYDTIIEVVPIKLIAWGKYGEGRWTGSDLMRVWSF